MDNTRFVTRSLTIQRQLWENVGKGLTTWPSSWAQVAWRLRREDPGANRELRKKRKKPLLPWTETGPITVRLGCDIRLIMKCPTCTNDLMHLILDRYYCRTCNQDWVIRPKPHEVQVRVSVWPLVVAVAVLISAQTSQVTELWIAVFLLLQV